MYLLSPVTDIVIIKRVVGRTEDVVTNIHYESILEKMTEETKILIDRIERFLHKNADA